MHRRDLIRCGLAAAALVGTGMGRTASAQVFEAPGFFTFEAQMVAHNPGDPILAAFAAGQIDRYTHYQGAYNSLAGAVRRVFRGETAPPYGPFRKYAGPAQFHVWGWSGRGLERAYILDATGNRQAVPRPKPYRVDIPAFGPADLIFDLTGADLMIAFPADFYVPETKAQWCAPTVPGIRPTPDIGRRSPGIGVSPPRSPRPSSS